MRSFSLTVGAGLVAVILISPLAAQAAGDSNLRFQLNSPNYDQQVLAVSGDMHLKSFDPAFGLTSHFGLTPGWGQIYAGPYWKPLPKLYASAGVGLRQQGTDGWADRFGLLAKYNLTNGYLAAVTEFDSRAFIHGNYRGFWYELSVATAVEPTMNAGLRMRQGIGTGGYIEVMGPSGIVPIFAWLPFNQEFLWDGRHGFDPCRGYIAIKMDF